MTFIHTALHVKENKKPLNKLSSNPPTMIPFCVELKVLEAALSSAVLYGCEVWLKIRMKSVESLHMTWGEVYDI